MPTCKQCKDKFIPKYFLQKHCMKNDVCVRAELDMKYAQKQKQEKKALKEDTAERAKKLMRYGDYIQLLQVQFNAYIRARDKDLDCISCGKSRYDKKIVFAAGHFYPTTYQYLRFNEDNVHKQCNKYCNMMKRGNLLEYRPNLIKKIGMERFLALENSRHLTLQLSIPEIQEKITHYKTLTKKLNQ